MVSVLKGKQIILFDLDGTLFDHDYSMRTGLLAVKNRFVDLFGDTNIEGLVNVYDTSLREAYNLYLAKTITYEEKDQRKIELFYRNLDKPIPTPQNIKTFQQVYDQAYMNVRCATIGTIDTLTCLKTNGFRLYIATNGQQEDQVSKAEKIGVGPFIDELFTSEKIGKVKPNPEFFQEILERLKTTPQKSVMVGDNLTSDIEGALSVGITAILYAPRSSANEFLINATSVNVIHNMIELLGYLGIREGSRKNRERDY